MSEFKDTNYSNQEFILKILFTIHHKRRHHLQKALIKVKFCHLSFMEKKFFYYVSNWTLNFIRFQILI